MIPSISVIICTHNPRSEYLSSVLQALNLQTLPKEMWELLLIDNLSEKILSTEIDLSWHPNSQHIREEQLGLTHARLRGIKESVAEVLVFVDDDNVLDVDYLEVALKISKDYQFIGAWGGQIRAEFEEQPPEWTKPYWWRLALQEFELDSWSNVIGTSTPPCGAGMCVKKAVAYKYVDLTCKDPKRINLGRKGQSLVSCEDIDLAFTACDIGLGIGRFTKLKLTHLIPANRLREDYLLKLTEGHAYSQTILNSFRDQLSKPKHTWRTKLREAYLTWEMTPRDRQFYQAHKRGEDLAFKELFDT